MLLIEQDSKKELFIGVEVWVRLRKCTSPILRQQNEVGVYLLTSILLRMKVRTVALATPLHLFAGAGLVVAWVVLLLLPPMAEGASVFVLTAIAVRPDEVIDFPVWTELLLIRVNVWLPSQVLPIMGVHTRLFIVVFTPRTPDSFEVKHVEVSIFWLDGVKKVDCDFVF